MLRGHSLDVIASELLKVDNSLSLQHEHGPTIVVEFMARPQMEFSQEMHGISLPLGASSLQKWNLVHSTMMQDLEQKFAASVEFEPLREILKKPLVDSSPIHLGEVMEDAIAKPHDVPDLTSTVADVSLELPSSVESSTKHPDI